MRSPASHSNEIEGMAPVSHIGRGTRRVGTRLALLVAAGLMAIAISAPAAMAAFGDNFGIESFSVDILDQGGQPETGAGEHPDAVTVRFDLNKTTEVGGTLPDGYAKDVVVDLPPGFVGDPSATPVKCSVSELLSVKILERTGGCPIASQVGLAEYRISNQLGVIPGWAPIYNMKAPPGVPARFGFAAVLNTPVLIDASVRSDGDYGLTMSSLRTSQGLNLVGASMTFWGVPADPSHDFQRGEGILGECGWFGVSVGSCPANAPRKAFLTNPTRCGAGTLPWSIEMDSWSKPGAFVSDVVTEDSGGNAFTVNDCDKLDFDPRVAVRPTSSEAGAPTGLDVEVTVPQNDDPDGRTTSHVRKVVMGLPDGMAVSAASAAGLFACSPAQIGLDDTDSPTCPEASKIGSVTIDTPLLEKPMNGSVFLAEQGNNPFSSLLALYLVAEGSGVVVKLPGRIDTDAQTGRVTAVFDNTPQLPFERLSVRLKGGARAPLMNPPSCGTKTVTTTLSPWSGTPDQVRTSAFSVDQGCVPLGFEPAFDAGSSNPVAGAFSPFVARVTRDGANQRELGRLSVSLPEGLLARVRDVPVCQNAQLAAIATMSGRAAQQASACPAESQIGTTTVGAGPGPMPFYPSLPGTQWSGRVFLTEAHTATRFAGSGTQAKYGLAFEVPAVAGPFDLGTVLVRAAIYVDPVTAELEAVTDQLPRILNGIPLEVRDVRVNVDRDRFVFNPTSCASDSVGAEILAQDGTAASRASRFQVAECGSLRFTPKLAMSLLGRRQRGTGGHPGVTAVLTAPAGQANIDRVAVVLPRAVVLDAKRAANPALLCSYEGGLAADCPARTVIGRAVANSPALKAPLSGPVHFVQGIRFHKRTGNRIRTLPTLLIKLRGEVAIDLRARSEVRKGRLVARFPQVPDAPISKFTLRLTGGKRGILVNNRPVCRADRTAIVEADAQNGKRRDFRIRLKAPCAKGARKG
jgi:hypothetical protein